MAVQSNRLGQKRRPSGLGTRERMVPDAIRGHLQTARRPGQAGDRIHPPVGGPNGHQPEGRRVAEHRHLRVIHFATRASLNRIMVGNLGSGPNTVASMMAGLPFSSFATSSAYFASKKNAASGSPDGSYPQTAPTTGWPD